MSEYEDNELELENTLPFSEDGKLEVVEKPKQTEEVAIVPEIVETPVPTVRASESLQLALVAKKLWQSGLFPNVRSEAGAFAIVQYGREMSVPPMTSLQNISIIQGKPAINGNLMLSLALKAGVRVEQVESDDKHCILDFTRKGYPSITAGFNEADAKQAGLIRSGSGYTKYPIDMYYWRAIARGLRRIAPDVTVGLYTVEEMTDGMHLTIDEVEKELDSQPKQIANAPKPFTQESVLGEDKPASKAQLGKLYYMHKGAKISDVDSEKFLKWRGKPDIELTSAIASKWIKFFEGKPKI
jgi:hypothetical protein